ncbi:MAG: DUF3467 domain-containing protein [Bacteroidales bacterium]|nr:DUF3467 domain-containing protein [Bacteroidales bacterium]
MEENKKPRELAIDLSPEMATGVYSNMAMITHSPSEFVADFVLMMPGVKPKVVSRVILTPEHAKRLLSALSDNIAKFEKENGEIKLPHTPQSPVLPPMNFGGDA